MTRAGFDEALWARAVDGDRDAVERCAEFDGDGALARRERLASALAIQARAFEIEGPAVAAWRSRLRQVAVHHMVLEEALDRTGRVLGDAGVSWAPLKGLDLTSRVYGRPEARPTSDIDVLIPTARLADARVALLGSGWQPLVDGPRADRYLREEGYAWQARAPGGVLVEAHFRLWGSMAAGVGDALLARASEDPSLGPGGFRLRLADAYALAAFHLWLDAPPRRLGAIRDLVMLARAARDRGEDDFVDGVCEISERFGLQLPTALAARWSTALWGDGACAAVEARLVPRLRRSEARFWRGVGDLGSASYARMTLARHLARRETRHGLLRLAWRRLWAHPGIVETAYDGDPRSFAVKRVLYQLRDWGLLS